MLVFFNSGCLGTGMKEKKNTLGFTLTEVLVAVLIATIGLTGIYLTSTQCLKQMWMARETSRAAMAIDYEIENLRTIPWDNVTALRPSYTMTTNSNSALALLNEGSGTVQLAPYGGSADLLQATVNVSWAGRSSSSTNMTEIIIISKNGFLR